MTKAQKMPSKGAQMPHGAPAGTSGKPKRDMGALWRVFERLFRYYPVLAPLTTACILFASVVSAIPSVFMQKVLESIDRWYQSGDAV